MVTKVIKRGFYTPRDGYSNFPVIDSREGMITDRQRKRLVEYIMSLHNDDKDEKEAKIAQLDEMTAAEADEVLFSTIKWG